MKIGYFITACNEYDELAKLLVLLRTNIQETDCIGILLDEENCSEEVQGLCNQFLNTHPLYSPICLFHTANCQSFTAKMWGYISGKFTMEPIRKYSKLYKGP